MRESSETAHTGPDAERAAGRFSASGFFARHLPAALSGNLSGPLCGSLSGPLYDILSGRMPGLADRGWRAEEPVRWK